MPIVVLMLILAASMFAPLPYDPLARGAGAPLLPPSADHWFGTDIAGFDVFSRTIRAGRLDVLLALTGALVSAVVGVLAGLYASNPGRQGEAAMRALDGFQAFPLLFLGVAVVTLGGNNLGYVVLAIALQNVPRFMRVIRTEALVIRQKRFFEASIAMGSSRSRAVLTHVLPNVRRAILVQFSLTTANAIVIIAALSFLGVGITPPEASWGTMIQSGSQSIATGQWWPVAFPGLAIFLVVMSLNWLADQLEESDSNRGPA